MIIPEFLIKTAEKYADKIAFSDENTEWRYTDVFHAAKSIASAIIEKHFFKMPIAVMMKKSSDEIVAFCGISFSGNFYTVLDEKMPQERLIKIVDKFMPAVIIADESCYDKAMEIAGEADVCLFSEMIKICEDEKSVDSVLEKIIDTDLLYVLFTSGSTGEPKGVTISHKSVDDYISWAINTFSFDESSVFGNQAPFYFDNSVLDIYTTLRCGATLYVIPHKCFVFPVTLLKYIEEKRINSVFWVPTVLSRVANLNILGKNDISCLNKILFAGEVMPTRDLNVWRKVLPQALYANLYGPTEITVDCTYYIVDREFEDDEPLPIGIPCKNTDVYLLDDKLQPVEPGKIGEIVVRGSSLSFGYYNDKNKTNEVFIQNPLNEKYIEYVYKTGDLGHFNEKNEIIFDGRKDLQIKHGGHRIELGEIETAVSSIKGIQFNACVHDDEKDKLVLYVQGDIEEQEIIEILGQKVPNYMLPSVVKKLSEMPMTNNGKIDRIKLKDLTIR